MVSLIYMGIFIFLVLLVVVQSEEHAHLRAPSPDKEEDHERRLIRLIFDCSLYCDARTDCHDQWDLPQHCDWVIQGYNACVSSCKFQDGSQSFSGYYRDCNSGIGHCSVCGVGGRQDRNPGKKCNTDTDCNNGYCGTFTGDYCAGRCGKLTPHGETSYWTGYRDCKGGLGQCSLCGIGNRQVSQSCTAHSDCTSGWCKNESSNECGGTCELPFPNGSPSSYQDYQDCKSGVGQCSICGVGGSKDRDFEQTCTINTDCINGYWCLNSTGNDCSGKCAKLTPHGSTSSYQDYRDCESGVGKCSRCGIGNRSLSQTCTDDSDCTSRKCDGATGNDCTGFCTTPIGSLDGGLSSNECSSLGSLEVNFPQLPYGCQNYVDPGANSYTEYLFNTANKDDEPFANVRDKTNDKCTSGWCVRSYSVMQTHLHNYGPNGMLSLSECGKLPKAYPGNSWFTFKVRYTELPYGCQHLYWNKYFNYVVYNLVNKDVKPFSNIGGETNEHCKSGWCVDSYSIMQVWGAKPISDKEVVNYVSKPYSVSYCSPRDLRICGHNYINPEEGGGSVSPGSHLSGLYNTGSNDELTLKFATLLPVVGNFISLGIVARDGYDGNELDFWMALAGVGLSAVSFGTGGMALRAGKVARFYKAVGASEQTRRAMHFQANLAGNLHTKATYGLFVESMEPDDEGKLPSPNTLFEWPADYNPQHDLDKVNEFALTEDSLLRRQGGCNTMKFPHEITSGEFLKDKQVGYVKGADAFHYRIIQWGLSEKSGDRIDIFELQWYFTEDLLGYIKKVRSTITKNTMLECETAKWTIQGYLDRLATCPIFTIDRVGEVLPYDRSVIKTYGYPNVKKICDI